MLIFEERVGDLFAWFASVGVRNRSFVDCVLAHCEPWLHARSIWVGEYVNTRHDGDPITTY
jgi:hypothetical protein